VEGEQDGGGQQQVRRGRRAACWHFLIEETFSPQFSGFPSEMFKLHRRSMRVGPSRRSFSGSRGNRLLPRLY